MVLLMTGAPRWATKGTKPYPNARPVLLKPYNLSGHTMQTTRSKEEDTGDIIGIKLKIKEKPSQQHVFKTMHHPTSSPWVLSQASK